MLKIKELTLKAYDELSWSGNRVPEIKDILSHIHAFNPKIKFSEDEIVTVLDEEIFYKYMLKYKNQPIESVW